MSTRTFARRMFATFSEPALNDPEASSPFSAERSNGCSVCRSAGFFGGEYRSAFKGAGLSFEEVRAYQPGDDVRTIDWNVTARTGQPFIKRYVEERELTLLLAVDVSASQRFGTGTTTKRAAAAELAALLSLAAAGNNDRVGLVAFSTQVERFVRPDKGPRHVLRLLRDILAFEPEHTGTGLAADVVFNLCEALDCDSRHEIVIPSLLDLMGVTYTGSAPFALGLALRKDRAKEVLRARGIPTPAAVCVESEDALPGILAALALPFPLIVKPTREDASVGIHASSVAHDLASLERAARAVLRDLDQPALIERFIDGREIYVSLLGNAPPRALPFHEIDFTDLPEGLPRIVSYAGKWDVESMECIGTRPTRCLIDEPLRERVEQVARAAFTALDLCDYARIDVRLAADGTPYVIDVNPNCDLSADAGFARAAGYDGLAYAVLIEEVCLAALARRTPARPALAAERRAG